MNNTIDICKELHQNFVDFAYEANSQRAFPDARDGLKPGQRACLWEMYSKGYTSNKPHVKSAKISGGVIANWWPHGDVAIYETFARMSQPWINNIPEVNWHGANGNIVIGNEPASARYTEARLDKATEEGMFQGIKKKNVPMILNFSEDEEWPEVLPAIMPRLLINGSQGIGVTISNTWLPMNLTEITTSLTNYIMTGKIDYSNALIDFPSGGTIINSKDISTIHQTGKGKVIVRAKAEIKKNSILITELPYQVFVEPLMEEIKKLIQEEELDDIKEIYNKTDKKRLLIEIECKNNPESTLKKLYAKTNLQKNFNANQFALVGKTPQLLTLKNYYNIYIEHNEKCIQKEYEFDLEKAKDRLNIVNGLLIALEDIDNVIQLIKKSESSEKAKNALKEKYSLNEEQAKAIVNMKLGKIANLEKIELRKEQEELENEVKKIINILSNREEIVKVLINRLTSFTKKYGKPRKTQLENISLPTSKDEKEIEVVTPEDVVVVLSQNGEIKRVAKSKFKVQKRNTKGAKNLSDAIFDAISTNTIDNLMLFTNKGRMFRLLVDNIPEETNASKGININTLLKLEPQEEVIAINSFERQSTLKYVIFITKKGQFKKTSIEEYKSVKKTTGIIAIKLNEGDSIANVAFANEEDFLIITKTGLSIRFETKDIAAIGRNTTGVKSIKLGDNDEVLIGMPIVNEKDQVAIFATNGIGKKVSMEEFPLQGRAGKGVKCSESELSGACMVEEDSQILIIGNKNNLCISASELPLLKRSSGGNIIIKNNNIKNITRL